MCVRPARCGTRRCRILPTSAPRRRRAPRGRATPKGPRANSCAVERTIDLGEEGRYLVAVAGDAAEIDEETRSFDGALVITFAVLGIVLLLTTTFQVRFGLAPLKRISEGLAAI